MGTKFTKGEWVNLKMSDWMNRDEMEANAKLIAAAPNLYNACQEMMAHFYENYLPQCDAYHKMKEALKKATE